MSTKEIKQTKSYTKGQITKSLAPYTLIIVMVVAGLGLAGGWFMRSDFDNTIRTEVSTQYEQLKKAGK